MNIILSKVSTAMYILLFTAPWFTVIRFNIKSRQHPKLKFVCGSQYFISNPRIKHQISCVLTRSSIPDILFLPFHFRPVPQVRLALKFSLQKAGKPCR